MRHDLRRGLFRVTRQWHAPCISFVAVCGQLLDVLSGSSSGMQGVLHAVCEKKAVHMSHVLPVGKEGRPPIRQKQASAGKDQSMTTRAVESVDAWCYYDSTMCRRREERCCCALRDVGPSGIDP